MCRQVRFGDAGSIKGTAKEAEMRMRRQRYAQKRGRGSASSGCVLKARDAALPWPVRAVVAVLDSVLRHGVIKKGLRKS